MIAGRLSDTHSVLQYLFDAREVIRWFNTTIGERRLALIGPMKKIWPWSGSILHYYHDTYTPLSSTTQNINLSVSSPPARPENRNRGLVEEMRRQRVTNVTSRVRMVVSEPGQRVLRSLGEANSAMMERARRQGVTNPVIRRRQLSQIRPQPRMRAMAFSALDDVESGEEVGKGGAEVAESREAGDDVEIVGMEWEEPCVIPESAEEFVALSEKFLAQCADDDGIAGSDPFEVDLEADLEALALICTELKPVEEPPASEVDSDVPASTSTQVV